MLDALAHRELLAERASRMLALAERLEGQIPSVGGIGLAPGVLAVGAVLGRYAVLALTRHLGRGNVSSDTAAPYWAFTQNIDALVRLSGITATVRELNWYLWIAGAYH